ncbi:MAG: sodium:proton antiporter [Bacteroidetes bacterium]|nr:sodium:proton antiporter [Bacteroidota bacterium]
MYLFIAIIFVLGYVAIALEHPLKINKAASALLTAVFCWVALAIGRDDILHVSGESGILKMDETLMHHIGDIGGILFFLLGAMTIVELVDAHGGFSIITQRISTTSKSKLLVILSLTTFFMSSVLDNLTTSIVMATLLRKIIHDKEDLWMFAGLMIIAANAGGAWSPIGDVTTIMLWIGGNVSAAHIVMKVLIPSLVCIGVPLAILSFKMKGNLQTATGHDLAHKGAIHVPEREKRLVLIMGTAALLFVPVFKTLTHLPPFIGILFGLGSLWVTTEILHRNKESQHRKSLSISSVLERVDTPSILFFLGILLAVAALQTAGHLAQLAHSLEEHLGSIWWINTVIGLLSSVVDNVPLVAGAMGMYNLSLYPQDHLFWDLLAFCAGTGGSCLIIGSAAGVATMGILHIDFLWYLKRISLLALSGYVSGIAVFWLMHQFLG